MSSFIHTAHTYLLLLARYLIIFTVIGFMPVPLFSFLGGDSLTHIDHNPLFDYFSSYEKVSTDAIIEHVFTNVYLEEGNKEVEKWEIDNAVMWADAMAYRLAEEGVPVVKHVIKKEKDSDVKSVRTVYAQVVQESLLPEQIQNILLTLKNKFQLLLPIDPITQDARQWLILALSSSQKSIKKQLKSLVDQYPNDNFLVITRNPVNLSSKKTYQLGLPNFNTKQAKKALSEGLKITQAQAEILLVENEKSLWALNDKKGQVQEITFKSLLGESYKVLDGLAGKKQEVLNELCKEGKVKVSGKKMDLTQYGVIIKNKHYQWQSENARINYQLQKETLCGNKAWIDVEEGDQVEEDLKKNQKKQKEILQRSESGLEKNDDQKEEKNFQAKEDDKKKTDKKDKSKERKQVNKADNKDEEKKPNQQSTNDKQPESIESVNQVQPQAETVYQC